MSIISPAWRLAPAILAAILAILVSHPAPAAQKYDAAVSRLITNPASALREQAATAKSLQRGDDEILVEVLVRFQGNGLQRLRDLGIPVRGVLGNIASAEIPLGSLGYVASLPEVLYIEGGKNLPSRLNFSVPATRADRARTGTAPNFTGGQTGRNVIVGIIDDGLDFRHLDFRNADGSTRLLALWDQRASGASGTPPSGFSYGGECTAAMIAAAIGGDASACLQPSSGNHGTHVGGIAAGNGQQTGNGRAAYRFVGMAPEADILSANSIATGVSGGNAVVDAIAWMKARAQAVGKPIVINLSLGSYYGARDGTSNFEQALSAAGEAGIVLVAAAGNESGDRIRAIGSISQGETASVRFEWSESITKDQKLEMWYPGIDQYAVKVTGPNGCQSAFVAAGNTQTFSTPGCGTIEITSTAPQASNDDRQIVVELARTSAMSGAWTIEIRGDTVSAPATPFSIICADDGTSLLFTSNTETVTRSILTDTASATRTIGVGSYNTNYGWESTSGPVSHPPSHGPLGDISTFSSRGPRRDCSNPAKCPPAMKPEIVAPGAMIMAALAHDAAVPTDGTVEADGRHVALNGTSMATPHVSGAVALMLQKDPTLTPEAVKRLLAQNRQGNAFTAAAGVATYDPASPLMPANPNYTFGYGLLDAQAAINAIASSSIGGLAASDNVTGLWWNAAESGWGLNLNHQGNLMFATLFTYGGDGGSLWLVLPAGARQGDGSYQGAIYQTTGPAFNANPFPPIGGSVGSVTQVGTMAIAFTSRSQATLQYSYNGASVTKQVTPQVFARQQSCGNTSGNTSGARAGRTNYTDLWWVPAESGWGVNVTHQDDTLFATIFTYEAGSGDSNRGIWLVMSGGSRQADGSYSGDLFRTTGPPFNAIPFTPIGPANVTRVGTMRFAFSDGEHGTLTYDVNGASVTKQIVPQAFGNQLPTCARGG